MGKLVSEDLTEQVIGAAIDVHRELGPGLLESAYEECLCYELSQRGLSFRRQVESPLKYKSIRLNCGYIADIIVEETVLLELKSVYDLHPIHDAQLITYLKITGLKVGLLINVNVPVLKEGIHRRVN